MALSSLSKVGPARPTMVTLAAMLAACNPGQGTGQGPGQGEMGTINTATPAPAPQVIFASRAHGVELAYPRSGVHITNPPNEDGSRLLSLTLDRSNSMMTGEFRLGVSEDPALRETCTQVPAFAHDDGDDTTTLDGVAFTTFTSSDAAMNHFQTVRSYRALHRERCYAIDLVVNGTNPEVYDPPRQAPFQRDQALERLEALLVGLAFKDG